MVEFKQFHSNFRSCLIHYFCDFYRSALIFLTLQGTSEKLKNVLNEAGLKVAMNGAGVKVACKCLNKSLKIYVLVILFFQIAVSRGNTTFIKKFSRELHTFNPIFFLRGGNLPLCSLFFIVITFNYLQLLLQSF